jgi:hypothetical protein
MFVSLASTGGLGIGSFGASSVHATGIVYDLETIQDFLGPYVTIRAGAAVGEKSIGRDVAPKFVWRHAPVRRGLTLRQPARVLAAQQARLQEPCGIECALTTAAARAGRCARSHRRHASCKRSPDQVC